MRSNFWTGIEGLPLFSLNCDTLLHSGLKIPELVMDASCTGGLPPCAHYHRTVVLSCPHPPRRWVVLERRSAWLVVNTEVKACSRETHSLSRASKIYGHKAFQNNTHATVINSGCTTLLNTAHAVGLCCGASLSTDCGYSHSLCRSHPYHLRNDL